MARQISECLPAWLISEFARIERAAARDTSAAQIRGSSALLGSPSGGLSNPVGGKLIESAVEAGEKRTGAEAPAEFREENNEISPTGWNNLLLLSAHAKAGRSMITVRRSSAAPASSKRPPASAVVIDLLVYREGRVHAARPSASA